MSADWHNVRHYGARGDGLHDDTRAIRRAIRAARQAGGGVVYFPAGSYAVTPQKRASALDLSGVTNISLLGAGLETSRIRLKNGHDIGGRSFALFSLSETTSYVTFRDLTLDGNQSGTTNPGEQAALVQISGSTDVIIERLELRNSPGDGIMLLGDDPDVAHNILIRGCTFRDNRGSGVVCQRAVEHTRLLENYFSGNSCHAIAFGPCSLKGTTGNLIFGNVIVHAGRQEAVLLGNPLHGDATRTNHLVFCHNQIIHGELSGANTGQLLFCQNIVLGRNAGPAVELSGFGKETLVSGNVLQSAAGAGVTVSSHSGDLTITSNRIQSAGPGIQLVETAIVAVHGNALSALPLASQGAAIVLAMTSEAHSLVGISIRDNDFFQFNTGIQYDVPFRRLKEPFVAGNRLVATGGQVGAR
ncbi:MAG: right-handed parallel beta-helix repeat-containing protein [Anaerolineales bacterium]|nr:right-handed parallel beta-helix repeat-containing protein [Anaerolineales bacterium]